MNIEIINNRASNPFFARMAVRAWVRKYVRLENKMWELDNNSVVGYMVRGYHHLHTPYKQEIGRSVYNTISALEENNWGMRSGIRVLFDSITLKDGKIDRYRTEENTGLRRALFRLSKEDEFLKSRLINDLKKILCETKTKR